MDRRCGRYKELWSSDPPNGINPLRQQKIGAILQHASGYCRYATDMADRLFVGMRLDTDAAAELARRAEAFDDRLVRRIASENLHVTLLFIGDPAPATADDLVRALTPAMDAVRAGGAFSAPVRAEIDRWGAFPPRRTPRVLWAGLESPTMEVLARRVVAALEPQGALVWRRLLELFNHHRDLIRTLRRHKDRFADDIQTVENMLNALR